jgi:hypothetical protein
MTELLFLPWRNLQPAERRVLLGLFVAVVGAALVPAVQQDPAYHRFADQRHWMRIANAADVLSNLAFLAVGVCAVLRLSSARGHKFSPATRAGLWCAALGFCLTALGSSWYHLQPSDATLVWDRIPMTLIFAGLLGIAVAQRLGENGARVTLAIMFELGVASVAYWHVTGNLAPYLLLQYGGFVALLLVLLAVRGSNDPFPWWYVVGLYAFAKALEIGDAAIWRATDGVIAGHALKHLFAAAAGAAALYPLLSSRQVHAAGAIPRSHGASLHGAE